jgi:hypothetical protein
MLAEVSFDAIQFLLVHGLNGINVLTLRRMLEREGVRLGRTGIKVTTLQIASTIREKPTLSLSVVCTSSVFSSGVSIGNLTRDGCSSRHERKA